MESFTYEGVNGQEIFACCWSADTKPRCVVQIIHGMAEHSGRYADFAGFLNTKGISVYASDLRGHGLTGEKNGNLCDLDHDGFNWIVEDQARLMKLLREKHTGVPLFILGHSFGSFIAQEFLKRYGNGINGAILSGSGFMKGVDIKLGLAVATVSMLFGSHRPNRLLNFLSFGTYNKRISSPKSAFSWLTRDENHVSAYEEDKYCGNVMSTGFYRCFFKGLNGLYLGKPGTPGKINIPSDLPVAIFAGTDDPVGKYGTGPEKLYGWYRSLGLTDLWIKLYKGGRHEILNEINKAEVYEDISAWIEKHLAV